VNTHVRTSVDVDGVELVVLKLLLQRNVSVGVTLVKLIILVCMCIVKYTCTWIHV